MRLVLFTLPKANRIWVTYERKNRIQVTCNCTGTVVWGYSADIIKCNSLFRLLCHYYDVYSNILSQCFHTLWSIGQKVKFTAFWNETLPGFLPCFLPSADSSMSSSYHMCIRQQLSFCVLFLISRSLAAISQSQSSQLICVGQWWTGPPRKSPARNMSLRYCAQCCCCCCQL